MSVIESVRVSRVVLPLEKPASDAKVLTGRQRPLSEVTFLFAEISTADGASGFGYSYALRAGGRALYAHALDLAPDLIGEDADDIQRLWSKLSWAGASVGRSGVSGQTIAAFDIALWDLKSKRAGLSLAKFLGAHRDAVSCYNTSGGYLSASTDEIVDAGQASLERGIGGIKIKVGQPDLREDLRRVETLRTALGDDVPLMVDANQQWSRSAAMRAGQELEKFRLTWIEEPLDAHDAVGHADLAQALVTPIATGEMLPSVQDHVELLRHRSVDIMQPDAPRVGGITPFLTVMTLGREQGVAMAPHFAMEVHIHLSAAYELDCWIEHFEWLEPLFEEKLRISGGKMLVPTQPGLGLTVSEQARRWTRESETFGAPYGS